MTRAMFGPLLALLAVLVVAACGGSAATSGTPDTAGADPSASRSGTTGERITVGGSEALEWGAGSYGVVLAHGLGFDAASWEAQAVRIAERDATVIAVQDISPDGILAAVEHLNERGIGEVALIGGSAGADAILELAASQPDLPDQLILLSANRPQDGLGPEPKLFVAAEDDPVADALGAGVDLEATCCR